MSSLPGRLALLAAMSLAAPVVHAQESSNRVATMTDWNVFEFPAICGSEPAGEACRQATEKPQECWAVSKPKESVNTRDGAPVSVRRGDILLFVTFRPGLPGEPSFTGGYPFAPGSAVEVAIDGQPYQFFTDGEWAWPGATEDDATFLAALKGGTTAVMSAKSGKGTKTVDTFSLRGFTAAMEDAEKRCQ
jgi:hypothetical protein